MVFHEGIVLTEGCYFIVKSTVQLCVVKFWDVMVAVQIAPPDGVAVAFHLGA